jgi:trimeric autotransporter adhesin
MGTIETVAGSGIIGLTGDGGPAREAALYNPSGVAVHASGNIYVADTYNHCIRMVMTNTSIITTVAGNGVSGYSGDGGPATSAALSYPYGTAVDGSGNLYVADTGNNCIRRVMTSTGIITTVAGNGVSGSSGDGGPATSAGLMNPSDVAVDGSGNIYIADTGNNRIRMVTKSTGIISSVAGTGVTGYSGDGGPAISAALSFPSGVAVDGLGSIYIADADNHCIRMVMTSTGIITTVAGSGVAGYSDDGGLATSAALSYPYGIAVDGSGNIYIADTGNNYIRMLMKSTGIITTVVGARILGYSGHGRLATSAALSYSYAIAVDGSGNLYVADTNSNRLLKFALPLPASSPLELL